MDWGPYDIASMVDLFRPRAIAIATAWIVRPITQIDPTDIKLQTEQHFAAAMTLELNDGRKIPVSYERAVCTHGHEISMVEVEGTLGAARWDWLGTEGKVSRTLDVNGKLETRESMYPDETGLIWSDRPVHHFLKAVRGEPSPALIDERALFNFSCLRAIYDAARTGQPQRIVAPAGGGCA